MTRARNSANLASQGNLFVDIANDRTGIGSVAPAQNLHVAGTAGFHGDTTFVGDSYNVTWDRSENKLKFDEFSGIRLGNNNELQIDHRGTSYILNIDSNPLQIGSNSLQLMNAGTTQTYLNASVNSDLLLYRAGSERFRTKDYGVQITGTTDTDGLVVSGVATVTTMNVTGVLTYDDVTSVDSVGIITARQGIRVPDGSTSANYISAGASDDIKLYHDGSTASIIKTKTGDQLSLQSDLFWVRNSANSESIIKGTADAAVELYHNNSKKLETAGHGINITGGFVATGDCSIPDKITHVGDLNTAIRFPAADTISFETAGSERVRIASNGRMGIGNNNPQFMIHTESSGNNGGVRIENSHTTTTVSGNTAAGAFPHNLILSNYGGSGSADNRLVSLGFDIPTTVSHANAQIVYQATGSGGQGDLQFWLENGNTTYERARFTAAGQFVMGTTSSSGARAIIQQNSSDTNPLDQQTCADSSGMRLQNYSFGVGRYTALSLECANSSSVQSASIIAQSVASGTSPDIIIAQRTSNSANTERLRITSGGNIGVAGATGTDFSLLDGMVINTGNGSAGLLINSSSSSHNAYMSFGYGSGSSTSHADQFSAYVGRVGDNNLIFGTNNSIRVQVTSSGHVVPGTDSQYDLGLTGTRWRNLYADTLYGDGSNLTGIDTDLVSDTSPQLGGDLDTNSHNILLDDDHEVKFGASSDLRIFHANGNANFIQSYNNHDLRIHTFGTSAKVRLQVNESENSVVCTPNGPTELYYDNEKMFQTNQDGSEFFDSDSNCNVYFSTNGSTRRGYIFAESTNGGKLSFYDPQNHPMLSCTKDGSVDLYYDNSLRFNTHSNGFEGYGGSFTFYGQEGGGSQLLIYADEGDDLNDRWRVLAGGSNDFEIGNLADGSWDTNIKAYGDGAVELYHNDSKKFETSSTGGSLTGVLSVSSNIRVSGEIDLGTANGNKFMDVCLGDNYGFYLRSTSGEGANHEALMLIERNKGATFYWDANKKLETTSVGCKITGGHGDGLQIENGGTNLSTQIKLKNTTVNKEYTLGVAGNTGANGQNSSFVFRDETANTTRLEINTSGHLLPGQGSTYDLGGTGRAWNNLYVNDMHFSNEGSSNSVDGTWGDWTLQEGENDVFMINNRTGKKFAITMREVS